MKIAVTRSGGFATKVVFHACTFADNILEYIAERCPALKTLTLPDFELEFYTRRRNQESILNMISKLKNLESLMTLVSDGNLMNILIQIHRQCPNFVSLGIRDKISNDIASAIVFLFPNIKHLILRESSLDRESLLILSGCRKLELLEVTDCKGLDANDDAMILTLASHIKIFKLKRLPVLGQLLQFRVL